MVGIDMRMPRNCGECRFKSHSWCAAKEAFDKRHEEVREKKRPTWCPLIELSAWEDDGK